MDNLLNITDLRALIQYMMKHAETGLTERAAEAFGKIRRLLDQALKNARASSSTPSRKDTTL